MSLSGRELTGWAGEKAVHLDTIIAIEPLEIINSPYAEYSEEARKQMCGPRELFEPVERCVTPIIKR